MIPIPGKKYVIACMGPYDFNKWAGVATCTENTCDYGEFIAFEFQLSERVLDVAYFIDEDIIAEAV